MSCSVWLGLGLLGGCALLGRSARAEQGTGAETKAETRERAALLAQALPDAVRARSLVALPPLLIVTGAAAGGLGVAIRSPAMVASGVVALGGGIGFYSQPERRNYELLSAAAAASSGLLYLSFDLPAPHRRWQVPISAGWFATSALGFINFGYATNPGRTRLLRDLAQVRTPAARSSLDAAEVQRIERDLYGTDFFVPQWAMGLPLALSGVIASAPVFDGDVAKRDKPLIGVIAAASLLQGLAISFAPTPASEYRSSLENAGLWVKWGVGPGGVSVSGSFD